MTIVMRLGQPVGPLRSRQLRSRRKGGGLEQSCRKATAMAAMDRLARTYVAIVMDVLPSRVFMSGNSQSVRIPAEFRLSSDRVQIRRTPEGDLIIHPCPSQRGQALLELLEGFSDDVVAALEQQRRDPLPVQERESL